MLDAKRQGVVNQQDGMNSGMFMPYQEVKTGEMARSLGNYFKTLEQPYCGSLPKRGSKKLSQKGMRHANRGQRQEAGVWIPAFAGMTVRASKILR